MYRRLGVWVCPCGSTPETGRSISVSSSFSFRACRASGRGEAACGRQGGDSSLAGASNSEFCLVAFSSCLFFVRRRVGSNDFCSNIDASEASFCAQAAGFQDSARVFFIFWRYTRGFYVFFMRFCSRDARPMLVLLRFPCFFFGIFCAFWTKPRELWACFSTLFCIFLWFWAYSRIFWVVFWNV